jgi:hypothetical protein
MGRAGGGDEHHTPAQQRPRHPQRAPVAGPACTNPTCWPRPACTCTDRLRTELAAQRARLQQQLAENAKAKVQGAALEALAVCVRVMEPALSGAEPSPEGLAELEARCRELAQRLADAERAKPPLRPGPRRVGGDTSGAGSAANRGSEAAAAWAAAIKAGDALERGDREVAIGGAGTSGGSGTSGGDGEDGNGGGDGANGDDEPWPYGLGLAPSEYIHR